jgi:hypothetical protein
MMLSNYKKNHLLYLFLLILSYDQSTYLFSQDGGANFLILPLTLPFGLSAVDIST